MPNASLVFLKLGGSLITHKDQPATARLEIIQSLASQVANALKKLPGLRLVIGHGSGSFGHTTARLYQTQAGVNTPAEWKGFAEVWLQASRLNRIVVEALHGVGLPAISFPPSAGATAHDRMVTAWDISPLQHGLERGLLPVVYGDVVVDTLLGGTILSTEMVFAYLAQQLQPGHILIAGIEPGVWEDFPTRTRILPTITPSHLETLSGTLKGSQSVDVTGGMESKVKEMLALCQQVPGLHIRIFSGLEPGAVEDALSGHPVGTELLGA